MQCVLVGKIKYRITPTRDMLGLIRDYFFIPSLIVEVIKVLLKRPFVFENQKCQFRPNCVEIHCGLIFHSKMVKIGGNLSRLLRKYRKKVETKKTKNADFSAEK